MDVSKRFAPMNEEDLRVLDQQKHSKNTKRVINQGINTFKSFLGENGLDLSELVENPIELNNQLRYFYASVRLRTGKEMKKKSLDSMKYGISKYLMDNYGINLKDQQFSSSNETYKSKLKQLKRSGHGTVDHKPVISDCDLEKLRQNCIPFNIDTPCGLQNMVWFNLMYFLIRRGQENLRSMTKSTFAVGRDSSGRKFVHQVIGEATKNHSVDDGPDDTTGDGKMYEQLDNMMCPVKCFEKYLSKLNPKMEALWQRPLETFEDTSDVWYANLPVGKNTLSAMMQNISRQAGLSQVYTNHCLRATAITKLDNGGFEARHIMRASGHKSESSIRSYATRLSEDQQRLMSECLSKPFNDTVQHTNDISEQALLEIFANDNIFEDVSANYINDQNEIVPLPQNHQPVPLNTHSAITGNIETVVNVQNQVMQQSFNRVEDINRNAPNFNFNNCQVHFHYN